MRLRRAVAVWLAAWLAWPAAGFGQGAEVALPDLVREAREARRPLVIEAPAALRAALVQAFGLHGGFRVVPAGTAGAGLARFSATGNTVRVDATLPGKAAVAFEASDAAPLTAALRAADAAVNALLGTPGFFAGRVAFVSDRDGAPAVYLADLLFQRPLKLPNNGRAVSLPKIAPDGRSVVFTSYRSGFPDVVRYDEAANAVLPVASFKGLNSPGGFAPDGRRVLLLLSPQGNTEVFVHTLGTKGFQRLTRNRTVESDPVWSPDGRQVLFASDQGGRPQLFLMAASGGEMRRVTTGLPHNTEPSWNPRDPSLIALTTLQGREFEIAVANLTTGRSDVVTAGPGDALAPCWLNDGRHLLYTERRGKAQRLMVLDTKTREAAPLFPTVTAACWQGTFAYPSR